MGKLFGFGVEFEDSPGFFEVEEVAVDDELPVAGVGRHLMDAFDGVTAVSKLFDEKIDVYIHGDQYTQGWCGGKLRIFGAVRNRSCTPDGCGSTSRLVW